MANNTRIVELELVPISPDTVDAKGQIPSLIEQALRENGQEELLLQGAITVKLGQTFPDTDVIKVIAYLVGPIALETYKAVVLPRLMERFGKRREVERPDSV